MNTHEVHTIWELYSKWEDHSKYYITENDLVLVQSKDSLELENVPKDSTTFSVASLLLPVKKVVKIDEDLYHTFVESPEGEDIELIDADIEYVFKPVKETK